MTNLNEIVQNAQGGEAVLNLANRFGLSPDQTQSVINAILPAFERGLQNQTQSASSMGGLLSELTNEAHQQAFQNADAAQSGTVKQAGGSVLGTLFGNPAIMTQIAQEASKITGIPASTIEAMLPTIASILIGGLFHTVQSGGLGGILSRSPQGGGSWDLKEDGVGCSGAFWATY